MPSLLRETPSQSNSAAEKALPQCETGEGTFKVVRRSLGGAILQEVSAMHSLRALLLAAGAGVLLAGAPALAATETYTAEMTAAKEVPPNNSTGTGAVQATYDTDTKMLTWTITYSGLSGDATAAHFHGPAAEGATAGPAVPIEGSLTSPIEGNATLTDQQAQDLQGGMWYFNIHTAQNPGGEIRGQLTKQ
jgi:hypothetical protein